MALGDADAYALWRLAAPRAVDDAAASRAPASAGRRAVDVERSIEVWQTLKSLYYPTGPSAAAWDALRTPSTAGRPRARANAAAAEDVDRRMIAEQPLIKPDAESTRAVVTSGNPLASQAGALMILKRAATSSTRASPWRSRSASWSRTRRALAATARRFCFSRA